MDARAIEQLLYSESGLLGVSGISSDMRTLLASAAPSARLAIDVYVYRIRRELGSLAAALGGLDSIVFTGGIGENAPAIRQRGCHDAAWLGVELDAAANLRGRPRVTAGPGRVSAWVIPSPGEIRTRPHTRAALERAGPEGVEGRARQAAAPGALGHEPRPELRLRSSQSSDQQVRPRRRLPRRPRPRRAGCAGAGVSRRHVLGGVPEQGRGRRR